MSSSPKKSLSPKSRGLNEEEYAAQQDRIKKAREAQTKRATKEQDFFTKYAYHIVIGSFLAVCLFAIGQTVLSGKKKVALIPVINDDEIEAFNRQPHTYKQGRNDFFNNWMLSDAKAIMSNQLTNKPQLNRCPTLEDSTIIPDKYNFRENFNVCNYTQIFNQGNCSSSYAIASISALQDRFCQAQNGNFKEVLSPQDAINCDKDFNVGCKGGSVTRVYDFARKYGVLSSTCTDKVYSASDEDEYCNTKKHANCERYKASEYCIASNEEGIKREILKFGPVVTVIPVYRDFLVYKSGVYQVLEGVSRFSSGHAVKIIGWDKTSNGDSYWIVENSWGETWGENGFGFIATGQKQLNIDEYAIAAMPNLKDGNEEETDSTADINQDQQSQNSDV